MYKFSIVDLGGNKGDIKYLVKELRQNSLIVGTDKDLVGETIYMTNNIVAVRKVMEDYDGLILDVHKE